MTDKQLYVAVLPPTEIIETIDALPTKAQRGVRYTKRDHWHIALQWLGTAKSADALDALAEMDASAADVTLGPEVSLLGNRVVIIPVAGLDNMAAAAAVSFGDVGEPRPGREFTGHLTIARLKGAPLRDPSLVPILGAAISAEFRASTVVVVSTEMTADGVDRRVIGEKTLGG